MKCARKFFEMKKDGGERENKPINAIRPATEKSSPEFF